jgi:hypothetical protein
MPQRIPRTARARQAVPPSGPVGWRRRCGAGQTPRGRKHEDRNERKARPGRDHVNQCVASQAKDVPQRNDEADDDPRQVAMGRRATAAEQRPQACYELWERDHCDIESDEPGFEVSDSRQPDLHREERDPRQQEHRSGGAQH